MTHRKYGRNRQRIHRAMARHGGRAPKYMRMLQATKAPMQEIVDQARKDIESAEAQKPKHWAKRDIFKSVKDVVKRRLFNRKTGS